MIEGVAITAEGLRKVYRLYEKPINRLKEILFRRRYHSEFVALDNITLKVGRGETFGIIGENGAGKSTLLKIISKTLTQTEGEMSIQGRVSSLLELGSGFHPEFTGIENIYFYGSLLGISPPEMKEKLDNIVSFADIGEHINYPLKTYSSGMYVRLAFSVAMAVDPDILVVDEALSVGDLYFQKKSTDRILSLKERGKTIVFCSHEMYHVARLCDRVVWLKNGRIHMEGKPLEVIQDYETYQLAKNSGPSETSTEAIPQPADAILGQSSTTPVIFIKSLQIHPSQTVRSGNDLHIKILTSTDDKSIPYRIAVKLRTVAGLDIIGIGTNKIEPFYGNRTITLLFPRIQLRSGTFIVEAYLFDAEGVYWYDRKEAVPLTIPRETIEYGIVDLPHEWIID